MLKKIVNALVVGGVLMTVKSAAWAEASRTLRIELVGVVRPKCTVQAQETKVTDTHLVLTTKEQCNTHHNIKITENKIPLRHHLNASPEEGTKQLVARRTKSSQNELYFIVVEAM